MGHPTRPMGHPTRPHLTAWGSNLRPLHPPHAQLTPTLSAKDAEGIHGSVRDGGGFSRPARLHLGVLLYLGTSTRPDVLKAVASLGAQGRVWHARHTL